MLFRKRKPSGRRRPQPSLVPTAEEAAKAELAIVEPPPPVATAGPPEAEAGGVLTIDCAAIAHNWRTLASHAAPAECAEAASRANVPCSVAASGSPNRNSPYAPSPRLESVMPICEADVYRTSAAGCST